MGARGKVIAGVVLAVALLIAGMVALRRDPEPVGAALAVLDDDGRFTTALEASDGFAEVSGLLGGIDCDATRDEACARAHRASAWAQITAVLIVTCAPSAVFEARANLARYVRGDGDLPAAPRCGTRRQTSSS